MAWAGRRIISTDGRTEPSRTTLPSSHDAVLVSGLARHPWARAPGELWRWGFGGSSCIVLSRAGPAKMRGQGDAFP